MRMIVTGGTGMIGRPLSAALAAAGHEVIVLTRNPATKAGMPAGVRLHKWDAATPAGWVELINANTVIINLAGENIAGDSFLPARWSHDRKQTLRDSRINTGHAVEAAVAAAAEKPRAVLQSSGVGYYPAGQSDRLFDEGGPAGNDFLAKLCIEWEASSAAVAEVGVRHVIMRTGIVLSAREGSLPRVLLPYRFFVGGPYGSGKQWWSWIHLEDQVRAIQFLAESDSAAGVYNVCAPNPLPNRRFGQALGRAMGRPSLIPIPAFALKLLVGEVATVVLDGQRAVPQALQRAGFSFNFPEAEAALRDLLQRKI